MEGYFSDLINTNDAAVLALCARIGVMDSGYQQKVREKVINQELLQALEKVNGTVNGETQDEKLAEALYTAFGLLMKPEDREKFPNVEKFIASYAERTGNHLLGKTRVGGQIDLYADSVKVRFHADNANALNAGHKKKKTQRQLEKEAKGLGGGPAFKLPEPAGSFQFTVKSTGVESNEEKIAFVRAALKQIGANDGAEVISHPPAHTMEEMPKGLDGYTCKNLFLKAKKPRKGVENDSCIWLISVPQEAKVNLKAISKQLGYKDELRQAKEDVLFDSMRLKPGGVSPFGLLNDDQRIVNVILDENMMASADNKMWFHPLTNEASMCITAQDLGLLLAASARSATLIPFEYENAGGEEGAKGADIVTDVAPLNLSHEEGQKRLWEKLGELGVEAPHKEENPDLEVTRPTGHSSHNLFVKDKKSKKLYLVSARQDRDINLKEVAKAVGAKELRMASTFKESFSQERGCITLLSLYNNVQGDVNPVIDSQLLVDDNASLRICAGCENPGDHSQHNIVDIKVSTLKQLLGDRLKNAISIDMK